MKIVAENPGGSCKGGFSPHPVLTGIKSLCEGFTIAAVCYPACVLHRGGVLPCLRTIAAVCYPAGSVLPCLRTPLVCSSYCQTVTACYDAGGARILLDCCFTWLYKDRWEHTAGTARFVRNLNAACWLYNYEGLVARDHHAAARGCWLLRQGLAQDA